MLYNAHGYVQVFKSEARRWSMGSMLHPAWCITLSSSQSAVSQRFCLHFRTSSPLVRTYRTCTGTSS